MSRPRLLGGEDGTSISTLLATVTTLTGMSPSTLTHTLQSHIRSSPHTTLQIALGSTIHLTHLIGLTPYRTLLFHPRLFLAPRYQLWRGITGFCVLGHGIVEVFQRAVGMVYWQAPLEKWFDGEGDLVKDGVVLREGQNRRKRSGGRKNVLEWLVTDNHFLRAQLLAGVVLVGIELALYRAPPAPVSTTSFLTTATPSLLLFPYSLYPNLEYAFRWLWAITTPSTSLTLFGVLPIQPVYIPLCLCALGGFGAWKAMLKGLVAAMVVGKVMDLRRIGGDNAVDWLWKTIVGWAAWGQAVASGGRLSGSGETRGLPDTQTTSLMGNVASFFAPVVPTEGAQPGPYGGHGTRRVGEDLSGPETARIVELN
ncbi:hypothetical protein SpCBS45565_g02859 [Spizellomyces sp. 'palustris']|nr:hypothetical protein SpCBS45565_g02859 [Spizellomyces sp. 'palustris']